MPCDEEFICACGDDKNCVETMSKIFGSLSIQNINGNDVEKFKSVCSAFDKFIIGDCTEK